MLMTHTNASRHGFVTLLEAFRSTGGTAPGDIVGRLLADHGVGEAVSLAKLVHSGQVFGFEWRGSLWIPMFQFNPYDLSIVVTSQTVRAELPELWSGWTVAMWFATANEQLDGRMPVELLGSDFPAVLQAAQALASTEDTSFMQARQKFEFAAHA
jgi:hypothetical protein